ncbi:MAG: hypothetical protein HY397_03220 [Candidatus Doudnabacteria bacterium]|nr:hypothetical protein [Candidatus Doudnabacteria bacterium]
MFVLRPCPVEIRKSGMSVVVLQPAKQFIPSANLLDDLLVAVLSSRFCCQQKSATSFCVVIEEFGFMFRREQDQLGISLFSGGHPARLTHEFGKVLDFYEQAIERLFDTPVTLLGRVFPPGALAGIADRRLVRALCWRLLVDWQGEEFAGEVFCLVSPRRSPAPLQPFPERRLATSDNVPVGL